MPDPTVEASVALIAAAGASLTAWIAGLFSLLGLLASKEQKISEFRQVWIDAIRADIAKLIAHAHLIHAYSVKPDPWNYSDFLDQTRIDYLAINRASTRIKLRLNKDECESRLVLQSMSDLEELLKSRPTDRATVATSLDHLYKITDSLEQNAPLLLKKEWKRVKSGEPIYRLAKWIGLIIFLVTGVLTIWLFAVKLR